MIVPERGGLRAMGGLAGALTMDPSFMNTRITEPRPTPLMNLGQSLGVAASGNVMNDMANTGMRIEPGVVGPMLDDYRARAEQYAQQGPQLPQLGTLGGMLPRQAMPQPTMPQPAFPQPGGGLGGQTGGGFGGQLGGMANMSIPNIAAQTVGETVSKSIESRLPQMSQGIGALISQTLLRNGGPQTNQIMAQSSGSNLKGMLGSLF